jgi:hypothetical protein
VATEVTRLQLLDTFPEFEEFWRSVRSEPVETQIDRWAHQYLSRWPELLEKQVQSYSTEGVDWKRIARTRIFPHLSERLPRMRRLHRNLLMTLAGSWSRAERFLELDFPVRFVIHVGIGVGTGWATRFGGQRACLFGLENAAETVSGPYAWTSGIVAHEVAHLAHDEWRVRDGQRGIELPRGPLWQLYEEGFATECERRIEGPRQFARRTGRPDWLRWCITHRAWLAAKFLGEVKARRSLRPFFGSWYGVRGRSECGYFLGVEVVRHWTRSASLNQVATLPEPIVLRRVKSTLRRMAVR